MAVEPVQRLAGRAVQRDSTTARPTGRGCAHMAMNNTAVNNTGASWRERDARGAGHARRPRTGLTGWSAARQHRQNGTVAWPGTPLSWRHGPDTIALIVGDRVVPVPDMVATPLLRNPRHSISHDPAVDLLL